MFSKLFDEVSFISHTHLCAAAASIPHQAARQEMRLLRRSMSATMSTSATTDARMEYTSTTMTMSAPMGPQGNHGMEYKSSRSTHWMFLITFVLFCITFSTTTTIATLTPIEKDVHVQMTAEWSAFPILLETAEFVANVNQQAFFQYLSLLPENAMSLTDREAFQTSKTLTHQLVGEKSASLLESALSFHLYSPRLEMHSNLLKDEIKKGEYPTEVEIELSTCPVILIASNSKLHCIATLDVSNILSNAGEARLYEWDKSFGAKAESSNDGPTVIIYADPRYPVSQKIHQYLVSLAEKGSIQYIYRPVSVSTSNPSASDPKLSVQGWSAELAVKNMEYKVLDDAPATSSSSQDAYTSFHDHSSEGGWLQKLFRNLENTFDAEEMTTFRSSLLSSLENERAIPEERKKSLGVQLSQLIMAASDPLETLCLLTQNFPAVAYAVSSISVNSTLKRAFSKNSLENSMSGTTLMSISGKAFDPSELDIFGLHSFLSQEALLVDSLSNLKLNPSEVAELLDVKKETSREDLIVAAYTRPDDAVPFLVNMSIGSEQSKRLVTWMNDITKDSRYSSWPTSVQEYMTPNWNQQLKLVRRNINNGIFVIDPTTSWGLNLFQQLYSMINFAKAGIPLRAGIILYIPPASSSYGEWDDELLGSSLSAYKRNAPAQMDQSSDGSLQARISNLFQHICATLSTVDAFEFLQRLAAIDGSLSEEVVDNLFIDTIDGVSANDILAILSSDESKHLVQETRDYLRERGYLTSDVAHVVINGVNYSYEPESHFRSFIMSILNAEQRKAQVRVYTGAFNDRTDFVKYWQSRSNTYTRLSAHILQSSKNHFLTSLPAIKPPSSSEKFIYLLPSDSEKANAIQPLSYWVVADWSTTSGIALVAAALQHLHLGHEDYLSRVTFIHHPIDEENYWLPKYAAARLASAMMHSSLSGSSKLLRYLRQVVTIAHHYDGESPDLIVTALQSLIEHTPALTKFSRYLSKSSTNLVTPSLNPNFSDKEFRQLFGMDLTAPLIVANGYVVHFPAVFTKMDALYDVQLLDIYTSRTLNLQKYAQKISSFPFSDLPADDLTSEWYSDVTLYVTHTLTSKPISVSSLNSANEHSFPNLDRKNVDGMFVSSSPSGWLHVSVLLNPLTRPAQRIAPLLLALRDHFNCTIQVWLNPLMEVSEIPLQRYYRTAIQSQLQFSAEQGDALLPFRGITFDSLTTKAVLTMSIETPEPWLISVESSEFDLDNLRVELLGDRRSTYVQYALEHLLAHGQCFEYGSNPVSGLQLQLSRAVVEPVDTIVMHNLGYFQLKGNPGVWDVTFPGHHNDIYQFDDLSNSNQSSNGADSRPLSIYSFTYPLSRLSVIRRPGQEFTELLTNFDWDPPAGDAVHIFSLASGHLYERFLKIMMLSVIKKTNSPVKFWFIRNFASPQFVDFVPKMAKYYGFEVEFITYKWPRWLRRQTEKQRVIWGYKILFLDVLWPLQLNRVIYIDADQIVRGDVAELWSLDLQGSVYAYTPFCDSNPDTEGFRFWKQGYWRDYLRGKPYHISALYVVDLQRFRATRAGDSLRSMYDQLSADPNSLANLDQDLPNHAQHLVPIYSLPTEWLWCQTWCSMETLSSAKTIDLCNNPLTKTPKLDVAKSLIPEWVDYDTEAKNLEQIFKSGLDSNEQNSVNYDVGAEMSKLSSASKL